MNREALARLAGNTSEDADVKVGHERGSDGTGSAAAAATAADNGSGCASTSRHPMLSAATVLTIGCRQRGHDEASVGDTVTTRSRQSGQQAWVM